MGDKGIITTSQREVSDAWFAKMEQVYEKATIMFVNHPEFAQINKIYTKTTSKLKKKKREIIALIAFPFIFLFATVLLIVIIEVLPGPSTEKQMEFANGKQEDSLNQSSENELEKFVLGYEKAEFFRFNSLASENGLKDTKIYLDCTLDKIELLAADGTTSILGYVTDDSANIWLVQMHAVPIVSETYYDRIVGKKIILRGVYNGYSQKKEMPVIILDELLVKETNEKMFGMQKLLEE